MYFLSSLNAASILVEYDNILIFEILGVVAILFLLLLHRRRTLNMHTKKLEEQKELYELVFKNTSSSVLIIDIEKNKFMD